MNPQKSGTGYYQNYPLHLLLFLLTVFTTLWAGAFWSGHPVTVKSTFPFLDNLASGTQYSLSLLLFLSVHEFGHFIAAQRHRVMATLPYYIPLPPLPFMLSLGTMGAVIKIRDRMPGTKALFDIGITGPLSGFIVCFGLLLYGFLNLPPADYIYTIHPELKASLTVHAPAPQGSLTLGKNLLWILLEKTIAPKELPPMSEMYHYPYLFTGWLGSLVTALNLLPVGQLDGGHIIYAMFGRKGHATSARGFLIFITILGFPSLLELLLSLLKPEAVSLIPELLLHWSWSGWILWAVILSRLIGMNHPPTEHDEPLSFSRYLIGWVAIAIFLLTFTPVPFGII
ncbi:site-2 protease family protein [Chlorobium ferrooxidans]|uniref:Peptidase M50 n=1 Tax=Chlorobium ferrooxidans DSM 13031 TaxID=377431 RepID=Q0YTQ6_9CHLB|nr:site-2 protease family protein [Chlorobium ferrooxidans]EAT59844.1 Peptidase M50 [Chlorobium ferrooxidans DSM 13031]